MGNIPDPWNWLNLLGIQPFTENESAIHAISLKPVLCWTNKEILIYLIHLNNTNASASRSEPYRSLFLGSKPYSTRVWCRPSNKFTSNSQIPLHIFTFIHTIITFHKIEPSVGPIHWSLLPFSQTSLPHYQLHESFSPLAAHLVGLLEACHVASSNDLEGVFLPCQSKSTLYPISQGSTYFEYFLGLTCYQHTHKEVNPPTPHAITYNDVSWTTRQHIRV